MCAVRGDGKARVDTQLVGALARELVVESEDTLRSLDRPRHAAAEHGADRVETVLERGDHANLRTATTYRPEEIRMLGSAGGQDPRVCRDDVGGQQVVAREGMLAVQPADAAPEGQARDAGGRDVPRRRGEAEGLALTVELGEGQPGLGARGTLLGIHPYPLHRGQVDHEAAFAHRLARHVVAAALHGHVQLVRSSEPDACRDVGRLCAADDHRRSAVDHGVEDAPGRLVAIIARQQHLAPHGRAQVAKRSIVDRHGSSLSGLRQRRCMEPTAITLGVHSERASEGNTHRLGTAEAAGGGDVRDAARCLLEQPSRGFHPDAVDEPSGRHANLAYEDTKEVARAHRHATGERVDGQVGPGVVEDPRL